LSQRLSGYISSEVCDSVQSDSSSNLTTGFIEIHTLEPYARLFASHASPNRSILLTPYTHPLFAFLPSLLHGHFLSSLTALSAFLSDILIVFLPNVAFFHGTTVAGYIVSIYVSVVILFIMIITLMLSFFCPLKPGLLNKPTTIAAVLIMICGSRMVESFRGLGAVDGKERDRRITDMGGSYGFGTVNGLDGVTRWGVDFEKFVDHGR
jgi:hypothetical protein